MILIFVDSAKQAFI